MSSNLNKEDERIDKIFSKIASLENVVKILKTDNDRMKAAIDSMRADKKVIYFFIFTFDRIRYFQFNFIYF